MVLDGICVFYLLALLLLPVHNLTTKWSLAFLAAVLGVQKAQQTSQECIVFPVDELW